MLKKLSLMRSRRKRGFTLIELIVTIAIIAVLAALALPSFNGLIEQSKKTVAEANARTVYSAAKAAYTIDGDFDSLSTYLGNGMGGTSSASLVSSKVVAVWSGNGYTATCSDGALSVAATVS